MSSPVLPAEFRFPRPTRENLQRLAQLAYATGSVHCTGCRDYHVTWPQLRAMGLNGAGPEFNLPLHVELLGRAVAGKRDPSWLLAGSADAGVLGAVQAAISALPPARHTITVVDRCPTPLALCRDHADATGLAIATVNADLMAFEPPTLFDVVVGHQIVLFFRHEDRPALFRRMASWLAPSGRLCLTIASQSQDGTSTKEFHQAINAWRVAAIRSEAAAGTAGLPEDVESFVARLAGRLERVNGDRKFSVEQYARQIEEAGLNILEITPMPDADPVSAAMRGERARYMIVSERTAP